MVQKQAKMTFFAETRRARGCGRVRGWARGFHFLESMDNKLLNARFPEAMSLLEQILEKKYDNLVENRDFRLS